MSAVVLSRTYGEQPFCEKEILRYAGCIDANDGITELMYACIKEVKNKLSFKVCYRVMPIEIDGDVCNFGAFRLQSENLAGNLKGCESAVIFAATIGVGIDRLIARYGRLAPSKALMLQAIGADRIEALCDTFCSDIAREYNMCTQPRFSPGYGDLPLTVQKDIFNLLDCEKRIGLTLNDSLIMSPSKSVTAFMGLGGKKRQVKSKCSVCNMKSCTFRSIV